MCMKIAHAAKCLNATALTIPVTIGTLCFKIIIVGTYVW